MRALERTFRRRVAPSEVVSVELAHHLAAVSFALGRQVGVLITREGTIRNVIVGSPGHLEIPEIGRLRGRLGRFRGLRLVHTHLAGEPLTADDLNDLALLRLDLVAMVEATTEGLAGRVELAHVLPPSAARLSSNGDAFRRLSFADAGRIDFDFSATIRALEDEFALLIRGQGLATARERVIVVGISNEEDRFEETLELAEAAGVEVAGTVRQRRRKPHPRTVVGPGKLRDIVLEGMRRQADVAVFDVDLKPAQAQAFENETGLRPIDRTQLILDIFAQRAKSCDGKLQVELARLKYLLPRLADRDAGLSRLTGGIGGRGPGETVLEVGRRRIFDRIRKLEKEIAGLSRQRSLRRSRRERSRVPKISIIGYTNAGKTTLLNALTCSSAEADDRLFVTLDPSTRRLRFPREGEVILSDTVGFLRDLPPDLVTAFRATLEELESADLLIHVIDASDQRLEAKKAAVERIIAEMSLQRIPLLTVLNKCDRLDPTEAASLARLLGGVAVSASRRTGLRNLIQQAERALLARWPGGLVPDLGRAPVQK